MSPDSDLPGRPLSVEMPGLRPRRRDVLRRRPSRTRLIRTRERSFDPSLEVARSDDGAWLGGEDHAAARSEHRVSGDRAEQCQQWLTCRVVFPHVAERSEEQGAWVERVEPTELAERPLASTRGFLRENVLLHNRGPVGIRRGAQGTSESKRWRLAIMIVWLVLGPPDTSPGTISLA